MALSHVGETWVVQSLSMGIVPLALRCSLHAVTSRLWGTVHDTRGCCPHDTRHKDRSHVSEEQIAVIVLLASDEECLHKTGCNLRALYHKAGFQVLYLPIPDFSVPAKDDLEQAVQHTIAHAQAVHHIVIHCSAGIRRTGLFVAYLAKWSLGLSGAEALQWVRRFIPRAVETPEQQR